MKRELIVLLFFWIIIFSLSISVSADMDKPIVNLEDWVMYDFIEYNSDGSVKERFEDYYHHWMSSFRGSSSGINEEIGCSYGTYDYDKRYYSSITYIYSYDDYSLKQVGEYPVLTTYDPPQKSRNFPLYVGKSWDSNFTQNLMEHNQTWEISLHFKCTDARDITVEAGTFFCYEVTIWTGNSENNYNILRKSYYNSNVGFFPVKELYKCSINDDYYCNSIELSRYYTSGEEYNQNITEPDDQSNQSNIVSSFTGTLSSSANLQLTDGVYVSATYSLDATMSIPGDGGAPGKSKNCEIILDNGRISLYVSVDKWGISQSGTAEQSLSVGTSTQIPIPNTAGMIKAPVSITASIGNIQCSNIISMNTNSITFTTEGTKNIPVIISNNANVGDYFDISAVVNLDLNVGVIVDVPLLGSQSLAKETVPMTSMSPALEMTGMVKSESFLGVGDFDFQMDNLSLIFGLVVLFIVLIIIFIIIRKRKTTKDKEKILEDYTKEIEPIKDGHMGENLQREEDVVEGAIDKKSTEKDEPKKNDIKRPKFCPECGQKLDRSPKFCPGCGNRLI